MYGKDAAFVHQLAEMFDRTERYILTLFYCEELTPMEIGLVLDLSAHVVEKTIESLRERTKAALAAWEAEGAAI